MADSVSSSPAPAAPSAPSASSSPSAPSAPASKGPATASAPGTAAGVDAKSVDPVASPQTSAPQAPAKQRFKLKVDQEEFEAEYTPEQLQTELQMARAARKRMQEAADIRKKWVQIQEMAKKDPDAVLRELAGIEDTDAWKLKAVEQKWKKDLMPEHERKLADLQAAHDKMQRELEAERSQRQQEWQAREQAKLEAQLEADFKAAFEAAQLPFEGEYLERFGKLALEALEYGVELTPAQMAAEVKAQLAAEEKQRQEAYVGKFRGLKGDDLLNVLGDEVAKEVIQAALAKHNKALTSTEPPPSPKPAPVEKGPTAEDLNSPAYWRRLGM